MKAFAHQFFTYLLTEKRVSTNTFSAYKTDILQLVDFTTQHSITPDTLSIKDLKEFLHSLKKEQLSASTMARKISSLKLFFSYLHEKGLSADFGSQLIFPKLEKKTPSLLIRRGSGAIIKGSRS